jgi:hypothetical protein
MLAAAPAQAQSPAGIDVHIAVSGLTEDYANAGAPLQYVVTRARLQYSLAANGSGLLESQRIGNGPQSRDDTFAPGQEPRGFTVGQGRGGQPVLRIWAQELPGEVSVPARFVRGDWNALSAGRPVTLVASARAVQRAHGVAQRIGQTATQWLRQNFSNAIPFMTIHIGDLALRRMDLSSDDVVIESNGRKLKVTYPDGELSYSAPVSMGR